MAITIGITEQGDGGLDLSWTDRLNKVNGAVVITKNLNDNCIKKLIQHKNKIILHCGCTGMGGTLYEPNVPSPVTQMTQLANLIAQGFDPEHVVLRIDPIIPTPEGLNYTKNVLDLLQAYRLNNLLPKLRIRISVIDMYPHARKRFEEAGLPLPYNNNFYASFAQLNSLTRLLAMYPYRYETCAEPFLNTNIYEHTGCISEKDLKVLGLTLDENTSVNPQNRKGCLCLTVKRELLSNKRQCPHGCRYCYWRD